MNISRANVIALGAVTAGLGTGGFAGSSWRVDRPGHPTGVELAAGLTAMVSVPVAFAGMLQLAGGSARLGAVMVAPMVGTVVAAGITNSGD